MKQKTAIKKLWGGNFKKLPSYEVLEFTSGWDMRAKKPYDERLLLYDIKVNKAHTQMLWKQGIISKSDMRALLKALASIDLDSFKFDPALEDVHTNIERYVIEKCGIAVGGKLHTARSRNDQSATMMRLYMKDKAEKFVRDLRLFAQILQKLSKKHSETRIPGFTHHRSAMVTTFGIVCGAWKESIMRDSARFLGWLALYDKSPLGSAAGYGTSFPIDREYTARLLGFKQTEPNILDPITNRGEAETALVFAIACLMKHFSQIAQTLILWSMPQFGYIVLPDEFCTGSSMMPHKKNPDVLEVIKAKAGFMYGLLQSLLAINTGNFIGYNRDMQWTKYAVMDAVDEAHPSIGILSRLLENISIKKYVLEKACKEYNVNITNMLELEVQKTGKPFRKAKRHIEQSLK